MSKKHTIEAKLPENKKVKVGETKPPYLLLKHKDRHFVIDQKDLPKSGLLRTLYDNFKETEPVEIKEDFDDDSLEYVLKHLRLSEGRLKREGSYVVSMDEYNNIRKICEYFAIKQEKVCKNMELHPFFKNVYTSDSRTSRKKGYCVTFIHLYCQSEEYVSVDIELEKDFDKLRITGLYEYKCHSISEGECKDSDGFGKDCFTICVYLKKYFMDLYFTTYQMKYELCKLDAEDTDDGTVVASEEICGSSRQLDFESDIIKIAYKE